MKALLAILIGLVVTMTAYPVAHRLFAVEGAQGAANWGGWELWTR